MKKVLLLTENFPPTEGGSCRWFWELYRRLPTDKILIVTHQSKDADDFDRTHNLNVVRMPLKCSEWGFRSVKGLAFYWRSVFMLRKLVKQYGIEEIHCGRAIHEGVIAWLLNKITGLPFICYVHGEDVETAATSREQALLVKQVCRCSRMLLCNSKNSASLVEKLGFSMRHKCQVLHPGVDLERFTPADTEQAFRNKMGWGEKFVLLTVGRLQRRKGQDYMIQALPALLAKYPNLLYVVVGQGDCLALLKGLSEEHKLSGYVQIHTNLSDDDLIKCYQQCDLFILPNRTIDNDIEGFGMVLVEAQACGKAVIAGNSGGTSETMKQQVTGAIINCHDVSSLVNDLDAILTSREYLNWQKHARHFVSEHLGWDAHVQRALKLINE